MNSPVRAETALVRPFAGIADADAPLEQVKLVVDGAAHRPGPVVLPSATLADAQLTVILPSPEEVRAHVEKTVVPTVDCGLVVMAAARTHRVTSILIQDHLRTASWPEEFTISRSSADLVFNDRSGFTLTVAVALLNDLTHEPLRPHLAGTWLARRDFRVSPETEDTSFSPEALSEDVRKHFGLPQGVLRYVRVEEVLEADAISDAVSVYLDPDVLSLLHANQTDKYAIQLQTELAVHVTEAVAAAITKALSSDGATPTPDLLDEHPAASRFMSRIASELDLSLMDVLFLTHDDPQTLRARLEAAFNLSATTTSALKEG